MCVLFSLLYRSLAECSEFLFCIVYLVNGRNHQAKKTHKKLVKSLRKQESEQLAMAEVSFLLFPQGLALTYNHFLA